MGRRSLPKIDPTIDLSNHLYSLDEWPEAAPVADAFGTARPLEIEIGCGKGLFLQTAALNAPNRNFLGVEIGGRYARYTAAKIAGFALENAVLFRGRGEKLLRDHVIDGTISAVHVYFPDPWWKARHRKRRVMNEPFVKRVVDVLKPDGALHFWTDVREYFDVTTRLLTREIDLGGPHEVCETTPNHDFDYRTHFERRVRRNGKPVYRVVYYKR